MKVTESIFRGTTTQPAAIRRYSARTGEAPFEPRSFRQRRREQRPTPVVEYVLISDPRGARTGRIVAQADGPTRTRPWFAFRRGDASTPKKNEPGFSGRALQGLQDLRIGEEILKRGKVYSLQVDEGHQEVSRAARGARERGG